jgi:hypothetical protein
VGESLWVATHQPTALPHLGSRDALVGASSAVSTYAGMGASRLLDGRDNERESQPLGTVRVQLLYAIGECQSVDPREVVSQPRPAIERVSICLAYLPGCRRALRADRYGLFSLSSSDIVAA